VHRGDNWVNVREGSDRAISRADTKAEAQAGRETARRDKVEHVIQNKNGQIGQKNSFGNDPRHSKG